MENIRLGNPAASDEEVREAARKACCQEFIEKLPQGCDTPAREAGKTPVRWRKAENCYCQNGIKKCTDRHP
ncbi:MAG: hypothetical protein ACLSBD_08265 [Blautia massiliensis (ex Durand et al. 2017)]